MKAITTRARCGNCVYYNNETNICSNEEWIFTLMMKDEYCKHHIDNEKWRIN